MSPTKRSLNARRRCARPGLRAQDRVADRMHQMRLAEPDATVDEQRVVGLAGILADLAARRPWRAGCSCRPRNCRRWNPAFSRPPITRPSPRSARAAADTAAPGCGAGRGPRAWCRPHRSRCLRRCRLRRAVGYRPPWSMGAGGREPTATVTMGASPVHGSGAASSPTRGSRWLVHPVDHEAGSARAGLQGSPAPSTACRGRTQVLYCCSGSSSSSAQGTAGPQRTLPRARFSWVKWPRGTTGGGKSIPRPVGPQKIVWPTGSGSAQLTPNRQALLNLCDPFFRRLRPLFYLSIYKLRAET